MKGRYKIRITKEFSFESAHALFGYDGKCKNLHGHSYKLQVTVIGFPIDDPSHAKNGMVMDFSDLKKMIKEDIISVFDHAAILNKETDHRILAQKLRDEGHKIILVDYQPTSEMMVLDFVSIIQKKLPKSVALYALKLQETETSFVEWYMTDN